MIQACWYLIILSIGTEYLSKHIFLLEACLFVGLTSILISRNFVIRREDNYNILGMFVILFGVMISRLFYTPYIPMLVNIAFVVKIFAFFMFVYLFITRSGFPFKTLYVIAFFSLPHFLAYVLGIVPLVNGQFPGLHGDPNYLSPDILSSVAASMFLINCKGLNRDLKIIFSLTLAISLYLIGLSVSRTAIMATLIIIVAFLMVKYCAEGKKMVLKLSVLLLIYFAMGEQLGNSISSSEYFTRPYNRFFNSGSGGDLIENERYLVWGISYKLIQETGLFEGYGTDNFLANQYRFGQHNAWLDIGIRMGSYTFWVHSVIYALGLFLWVFKFFSKGVHSIVHDTELFLIIFALSISFMIYSISVSHMYYYWFLLFLVYIRGFSVCPKNRPAF